MSWWTVRSVSWRRVVMLALPWRRPHTDRVQLSDHHAGGHLPGVSGMADVLEALRGVAPRLLPQNLLASGMLRTRTTPSRPEPEPERAGCHGNP